MKKREKAGWNGEPILPRSIAESDMWIFRKLREVVHAMDSVTIQEAYSLSDPENARKFNSLVEDIRYALMDYQVRPPEELALIVSNIASDFSTTRYLQRELSVDRESYSLTVRPSCSNL